MRHSLRLCLARNRLKVQRHRSQIGLASFAICVRDSDRGQRRCYYADRARFKVGFRDREVGFLKHIARVRAFKVVIHRFRNQSLSAEQPPGQNPKMLGSRFLNFLLVLRRDSQIAHRFLVYPTALVWLAQTAGGPFLRLVAPFRQVRFHFFAPISRPLTAAHIRGVWMCCSSEFSCLRKNIPIIARLDPRPPATRGEDDFLYGISINWVAYFFVKSLATAFSA